MTRLASAVRRAAAAAAIAGQLAVGPADAFCGLYVAQADAKLFNTASKVVLARDGDQTAITMSSDYQGDAKEFALVVPVPSFIQRQQIGVVDAATVDHIDAYSAPRLVEMQDPDPCPPPPSTVFGSVSGAAFPTRGAAAPGAARVNVEANYDVGEYDVSILSAEDSDGLVQWLKAKGYKVPADAAAVLGSYIRQNMRFFVARVNLDRMKLIGAGYLRPLQVRYASPRFLLPLRLGKLNAKGAQDLIVFALTRNGRVEATNYPNVKMPSGMDVPLYIKDAFGPFYKAVFDKAAERQNRRPVFVEYAGSLGNCDPCSARPMTGAELNELGARWVDETAAKGAYVTRLHVRYDAQSFPEDIAFEETADASGYQARYILRRPFAGAASCPAGKAYRSALRRAFQTQADALAELTGWARDEIGTRMNLTGQSLSSSN